MPTSFTVGSESDLNAALAQIDLGGASSQPSTAYTIAFGTSVTLSSDLYAINLAPGDTLAIQGGGHTLDGGGTHRGLFAYAGSIAINDLAIDDAQALGGNGNSSGGAGAGLGGGLFVASGASVSLGGVSFSRDGATGGTGVPGASFVEPAPAHPGLALRDARDRAGRGATGDVAGPGIVLGAAPGGGTQDGTPGGAGGGGGSSVTNIGGGGGGGGVGGGNTQGYGFPGGAGGFGGGGGTYGNGGFGGGGGLGGNGGFGGGGGGSVNGDGQPGFGGGQANGVSIMNIGGNGLGAGGAIFVQQGGTLTLASGTIGGNAATGGHAAFSNAGLSLGAGIFLQGDQQIALSPSAGQTLAIGDAIADQTGSTGQAGLSAAGDPLAGAGSLLVEGPGRVVLSASATSPYGETVLGETYSGGTTLTGGTLELTLRGPLGHGGDVVFAGPATLVLDVAPGYGQGAFSTIDGFAPGDTIDFRSLPGTTSPGSGSYQIQQNPADPQNVFIFNGATIEQLDITGAHDLQLGTAADGSLTLFEAPCFARGTRIDTPGGTAAVEDLAPGDRVLLSAGGSAPVRWVGHRRVDLRRHPRPESACPVRVRAGAFGPGLPRRDLVLSPEHALLLGGVLVPVRVLADGAAVAQESPERVTYFHVELDRHGVILAEGLPAESYLDTGNRDGFANGAVTSLHPDFAPGHTPAEPCAPMTLAGPQVEAARATLRLWRERQETSKQVLS